MKETPDITPVNEKMNAALSSNRPNGNLESNAQTLKEITGQPAGFKRLYNFKIPAGWKLINLSEKASIEYGISDSMDTTLLSGVKMLSLPNVDKNGNFICMDDVPFIDRRKVKKDNYLLKGDLLFNWRNGSKEHLGKTAYFDLEGEYTHVGFLLRIRTDHVDLDPIFLRSYINFLRNNGFFLGAKIQVNNTFNKEELSELPLMYPVPKEQQAIASILSKWDETLQTSIQLIAHKELSKKWLMQNLLTGKQRLKGFNGEWRRIGAGEVFKSITVKGFTNEELLSVTQDRGVVPRSMSVARVTMPSGETTGFKLVEAGDFVISLRSFQGGLEYSYYRGIVSPAYTVLKPRKKINDEYYKQYFKSYDFIGHLAVAVIGIRDGKQISYEDFCFVKIPYPSLEEQTAIAEILQTADNELQLLKDKLELLKEQKKGLMQILLTGKKRLKIH